MFRPLQQRLRETETKTPTALVNAYRPPSLRTPAIEYVSCGTKSIEKHMRASRRKNWDWQPTLVEKFCDISCVATATDGLHAGSWRSSSTDAICEYHRHKQVADELFLHSFCGLPKPVVGMCVQCLERSYPLLVLGREYKSGFIIKVCTFMVEVFAVGPSLLPDTLTGQRKCNFLETL